MKIDINKISRIYENKYNLLLEKLNNDKVAFYLLNDILIFICLQKLYNEKDRNITFKNYKNQMNKYEKNLKTNIFFDSYCNMKIDEEIFKTTYKQLFDLLNKEEFSIEVIQETLGYVLEKHINRKSTGSYYTPVDTTNYITSHSILLSILNKLPIELQKKIISLINKIIKKSKFRTNKNNYQIKDLYDIYKFNLDLDWLIPELFAKLENKELEEIDKQLSKIKIIDPTCGSGAFIISAFDYILKLKKLLNEKKDINLCEDVEKILSNIYGLDISTEAIILLRMRLVLKMLTIGVNTKKINNIFKKNFKIADAFSGKDYSIKDETIEGAFDWKSFKHKFDCIIGNPPYVESKSDNIVNFESIKCNNLYAYTIERAYNIANDDAIISFIVPLPLISTVRMKPIKEFMLNNSENIFFSTFADRPGCIFKGVHQRLTIFLGQVKESKTKEKCKIYTSSYQYWYNDEREKLFKKIEYIENNEENLIPKFGNTTEKNIYLKMQKSKDKLSDIINCDNDNNCLYLSTRIGLWTKSFIEKPSSNEFRKINCKNEETQYLLNAFFNSSTFYFFWILVSDCWHVTLTDLNNIKINMEKIEEKKELIKLSQELEKDLEKNKKYIGSKQVEFEYKHKLSKKIIDKIDNIILETYGLNAEEIEYVKNYAYQYRMNDLA